MDDIEEEKKLCFGKGSLDTDESECEEELPPWGAEPSDIESKQAEEEDIEVQEDNEESDSKSSSLPDFGDTPEYDHQKPTDAKDLPLEEARGDFAGDDAPCADATFTRFATMSLNIDLLQDNDVRAKMFTP